MACHRIIAVTAPSGAGKTTVARRLLAQFPQLRFSVSATTRPPRRTETHGKDYFFVSRQEFERLIHEDHLAEFEEVYPGTFYGTLRAEIAQASKAEPVLLDIDVKGALRLKKDYQDEAFVIFIKPPNMNALKERLRKRATESGRTLQVRLRRAAEEMQHANTFDAAIVNHDLDAAVARAVALIRHVLDAP